jgi:hypothetical protein
MTRMLMAVVALLTLGACGIVSSTKPLFGASDGRGAPLVRPGLWVLIQPGCRLNLQASPGKWPDCAYALTLRNGLISDPTPDPKGQVDDPAPYQLVNGDPAIIQVSAAGHDAGYVYFGFRPMAVGDDGAVTQARVWAALCAPPQPPGASKPSKPLPGLVANSARGDECEARTPRALRNAVTLSEAWAYSPDVSDRGWTAKWVRDR